MLGEHRVGELGCGVVPAARGRGVATEALRLLAEWALGTLGLGRLQVFVAPENSTGPMAMCTPPGRRLNRRPP